MSGKQSASILLLSTGSSLALGVSVVVLSLLVIIIA